MFRKFIIAIMAAFALMIGIVAPASAGTSGDGEFSFTVVGTDYDYAEAQFSIENSTFIKVGGGEQVSWEAENWTGKISAKQIRKAPRIHTKCTSANRRTQSQQIWRTTHHATIVVVLPGSCLWNRGKHDRIMMGFDWHVKSPAVLVGDKHHRYRHGFSLVRNRSQVAPDEEVVGKVKLMGKTWLIVRKCKNFIGGPVDVYVPDVVQLHYASDIKKSGKAVATSRVEGTVTFNITCPNGANFNTSVHTWAEGRAESMIEYTERTRVSVLEAHKAQLTVDAHGNGEATATSSAGSSITVSGSCGENPQETYEAPSIDVSPIACVNPGQLRDAIVTVYNPNGIADTAKVTYRGQVYSKSIAAHGQVAFTFPNQGQGSYSGTALLVTANKSRSFTVTVEPCQVPKPQLLEITTVNDVVVGNSRTLSVSGTVAPGHTATLFCTARNGGTITAGKSQSVSGSFTTSITYRAPSEVPGANSQYGIPAGHDQVACTLTQDDGQDDSIATDPSKFEIRAVPPESE